MESALIRTAPTRAIQLPQTQLIQSRAVRGHAVGRDRLRLNRLVVKETLEQLQPCLLIPPTLGQAVEDLTFSIDCILQVRPLADLTADHRIQASGATATSSNAGRSAAQA